MFLETSQGKRVLNIINPQKVPIRTLLIADGLVSGYGVCGSTKMLDTP